MQIGLFFDGANFYRSLEVVRADLEIDYDRLAAWIVDQVGGPGGRLAGAWYYTGLAGQSGLERFLRGLEQRRGYFVRRHKVVERNQDCPRCGQSSVVRVEKGVDVRIAVDMLQRAATGGLDVLVLLSGDEDLLPAVEAVQALGRPVWLASWSGQALSPALRAEAFAHLDLLDGVDAFGTGRARATEAAPPNASAAAEPTDVEVLRMVRAAADYFRLRGRHLSRWYFEKRWDREAGTGPSGEARELAVQRLLASGRLEVYETEINGRQVEALRVGPDGQGPG